MLRRLAIASVLVSAACASQQKTGDASQAVSVQERMRIANQPAFDVAICQSRPLSLPQPPNQPFFVGALTAVRSQVMECLVDPKHRGGEAVTKVSVKTTVTDQAAQHAVSGENLTPEGQKCVQDVVNTLVPLQPMAQGNDPVESQTDFIHEMDTSPAVTFGINEGSDFSGTVRLAQAQWCECYAPHKTQAPPVLTAKVVLRKGVPSAEVTFEPSGSTEGEQLAACLKEKILALPAKITVDELSFPYRFVHFHSLATEPSPNLPQELRFSQLELVRNQQAAETAMAFGRRANAAVAFDALWTRYNENPKKNQGLLPEIREKCAQLVQAAADWVAALEAQEKVDQQTLLLIQELKVTDASWAEVEAAGQTALANTQKDLATARQRHADDQQICPK